MHSSRHPPRWDAGPAADGARNPDPARPSSAEGSAEPASLPGSVRPPHSACPRGAADTAATAHPSAAARSPDATPILDAAPTPDATPTGNAAPTANVARSADAPPTSAAADAPTVGCSGSGTATRAHDDCTAPPALEVERVGVHLGGNPVLTAVSLTARAGEIVALLGPSGCGKTTLLRVIAGLQPHTGDVRWQGNSVAAVPAHRRGFGLVFQDQALFPHLDVARNVAFGLRMQARNFAERTRRVDELLELVGLTGFGQRSVDALSGGEAQRVALARALAPNPRLVMLDEPLAGLDRPLREQLLIDLPQILRQLRQTALFVTHDLEEALAVSDRVAVMRAGQVEQVGTPRALYERPASVFVAGFIGRANILHGTVRAGVLDTAIGPLPYAGPAPPGAAGAVLVRPEQIDLAAAAGPVPAERIDLTASTAPVQPEPIDLAEHDLGSDDPDEPGSATRRILPGTLHATSYRGIASIATVLVNDTPLLVVVAGDRSLPATGSPVTISFDLQRAVVPLSVAQRQPKP